MVISKRATNKYLCILLLSLLVYTPSYADKSDWALVERFNIQLSEAQAGKVSSMYAVGKLYERGRGADRNLALATEWFEKAAKAGNADAKSRLGMMYFEGRGVKQNYNKALRLLTAAVKSNVPSAQHQLASMYELGTGVAQNLQKAIYWYTQAEKNGYYLAEGKLARLQRLLKSRGMGGTINRTAQISHAAMAKIRPSTLMQAITKGQWSKRKKAVGYLPSNITNCVNNARNSLHCISTSQERSTGSEIITYNTESHVKISNKKSFTVIYSNNVLNVTALVVEDGDGNLIEQTPSRIKKGKQGKKRKLICQYKNNHVITCSKGSSSFELISR